MIINELKKDFIYSIWIIYVFSSIIILSTIRFNSLGNRIYILSKYLVMICNITFVFYIMCRKKRVNEWIIDLLIIFIGFMIYYSTGDLIIFNLVIVLCLAKYVSFKVIAKLTAYELLILIVIIMMLAFVGIIPNYTFKRENGILRYSLGFWYVSVLSGLWMVIMYLFIYTYKSNKKVMGLIFLISPIILIWINYITDTRTSLFEGLIILVLTLLRKKLINNKIFSYTLKYLFLILFCLSIIIAFKFDANNSFHAKMDEIFVTRLQLSSKLVNNYEVRLFGNRDVKLIGNNDIREDSTLQYSYIDNLYLQLLYRYGSAISIYIILRYFKIISVIEREQDETDVLLEIWIFVIIIGSLVIDSYNKVLLNIPLMGVMNRFYEKDYKEYLRRKINESKKVS